MILAKHCKGCKKVLRSSNKSGICSNCQQDFREKESKGTWIEKRRDAIGNGIRRTLNVTIKKTLWEKLNKYFIDNSINRAKWFEKIISKELK